MEQAKAQTGGFGELARKGRGIAASFIEPGRRRQAPNDHLCDFGIRGAPGSACSRGFFRAAGVNKIQSPTTRQYTGEQGGLQ